MSDQGNETGDGVLIDSLMFNFFTAFFTGFTHVGESLTE